MTENISWNFETLEIQERHDHCEHYSITGVDKQTGINYTGTAVYVDSNFSEIIDIEEE